jgi:hypothetical protein
MSVRELIMNIKQKIDTIFGDIPNDLFALKGLEESGTLSSPVPGNGNGGDGTVSGIARNIDIIGSKNKKEEEEIEETEDSDEEKDDDRS